MVVEKVLRKIRLVRSVSGPNFFIRLIFVRPRKPDFVTSRYVTMLGKLWLEAPRTRKILSAAIELPTNRAPYYGLNMKNFHPNEPSSAEININFGISACFAKLVKILSDTRTIEGKNEKNSTNKDRKTEENKK